ncbi:MAG: hypothetical protein ACOCRO_05890 [Halanaerobiales bacterium]
MAIKALQFYKAIDQYDEDEFYNFFLHVGNTMKYLSIEVATMDIQYIIEPYEEFEENILDNYELEETNINNKDQKQILIKVLRNEI